jgi:hypothetical protein
MPGRFVQSVAKSVRAMIWLRSAGGGIWTPWDSKPRLYRALRERIAESTGFT